VAHGFASLTDVTLWYLVDGYYNPADELGVAWDDPGIEADWGLSDPIISDRDRQNPRRADIPAGVQPRMGLRT
jgi:dTDP-4-dehydrorhamnose 3,5-epimerase